MIDLKNTNELIFVEGSSVSIFTEKVDYKRGEPIHITIVNTGTVPITYPDTSYGLRVTGLSGMLMFSPSSEETMTILHPKEEVEFVWDQIKNDGNAALEGLYKVSSKGVDPDGKKIEKSTTINLWK